MVCYSGSGYGGLHNLMELYLSHNKVSSIERDDFDHSDTEDEVFPHLRKLSLSYNRIVTIADASFR